MQFEEMKKMQANLEHIKEKLNNAENNIPYES
jgi:hypothetical protein